MFRSALVFVALVTLSNSVDAQITTFIAPPKPAMTPQMVAAADSVRRDSVAAFATTNMKAWVDSAAGVSIPDRVGDSTIVDPGKPDVTTTFSDGSLAPNTASILPALGIVGLAAGLVGAAMLRKPRA